MMPRATNLVLKFVLELAAFASFAYWGATAGSGVGAVALAIAAPAVAITLWAIFAAPKSQRRLSTPGRVPFELGVFALAALALGVAAGRGPGIVLAAIAAVNAVLLAAWGQLEA